MAESYAKAQRAKRDFDRTMNILHRENRMSLHLIARDQETVSSGLLDVQSKSKNLSDTVTYITTRLIEEKKAAEEQLRQMAIERSNARSLAELGPEYQDENINKIRKRAQHCRNKLDWLDPRRPVIKASLNVMDIITNKQTGFGGILTKIRAKKAADEPVPEPVEEPPPPTTPKDICSLIDHFKTLPKLYPTKPKKKKPKPTAVMLEKYAERKKEREMAMNYGTRRRLRRVDFLCDTIKDIFLTGALSPDQEEKKQALHGR